MTIGVDGFPIVAYREQDSTALHVAHCNDVGCVSSTTTAVDPGGFVGRHPDIVVGADGFPVIAYRDDGFTDLRVARCIDVACSAVVSNRIDTPLVDGIQIGMTVGADGLPIVTHGSATETNGVFAVAVTHCDDIACSTASTDLAASGFDSQIQSVDITIGSDGLPVVAIISNNTLTTIHCNDIACAGSDETATTAATTTFAPVAIAVGTDGLPVIAHRQGFDGDLIITHCTDIECTVSTSEQIVTTAIDGNVRGMVVGPEGYPLVAHGNLSLATTNCFDVTCSSSLTTACPSVVLQLSGSVTLSHDGNPIVAFEVGSAAPTSVRVLTIGRMSWAPNNWES